MDRLNHSCIRWGVSAFLLTFAWQAWAQDPTALPVVDPMTTMVVDLIRSGGLPMVVGVLIFLGRREGFGITLKVDPAVLPLLERGVRAIEDLKPRG